MSITAHKHSTDPSVYFGRGHAGHPAAWHWERNLQSTSMLAEEVNTTRSFHERASRIGIDMPIMTEVFRVLNADKDPRLAVSDLMLREPRSERLA